MGQLIVRRLDDATKARLKKRALRHGRSLEAEVRAILEHAAEGEEAEAPDPDAVGFGTLMHRRFSKNGLTKEEAREFNAGIDELRRGGKPRDPGFSR